MGKSLESPFKENLSGKPPEKVLEVAKTLLQGYKNDLEHNSIASSYLRSVGSAIAGVSIFRSIMHGTHELINHTGQNPKGIEDLALLIAGLALCFGGNELMDKFKKKLSEVDAVLDTK